MKLITVLISMLFVTSAFAGTAVSWKNDALGFTIIASPSTEIIEVCDSQDVCLQFKPTNDLERVTEYTEVSGKCKFTMELVDESYRDGSADEFMLDIMYQVVKVKEGNENCKLNSSYSGMRSLTGIYL